MPGFCSGGPSAGMEKRIPREKVVSEGFLQQVTSGERLKGSSEPGPSGLQAQTVTQGRDGSGHIGAAAYVASRGLEATLTRGTEPQKTSPPR